jgi:hypothetical protein
MCSATMTLGLVLVAFQGRDVDYKHEGEAKREVEDYYTRKFSSEPIKTGETTIDVLKLWPFSQELGTFCDVDHPVRIRALAELLKDNFDPSPEYPNKVHFLSALVDAMRCTSKELTGLDRKAILESLIGILERRWTNRKALSYNQIPVLLSLFDALPVRFIDDDGQRRRVLEIIKPAVKQFSNELEWRACRSAVVCWRLIGLDDDPRTWETLQAILERTTSIETNSKDQADIMELRRALIDAFADFGYGERRRLKEERKERASPDDSAKLALEINHEDDRWGGIADLLRGFLQANEKAIRLSAAKALGRIGPPCAEGAIDRLSDRLDPHIERDFDIRYASAIALKRIGLNQKAVRALLTSLHDLDPDFRDVAAEAMEKVGPDLIYGVLRAVDDGLIQFDPDGALKKGNPSATAEEPQRIQDAWARKKRADRVAVQLLAWNLDKRADERIDERLGIFLVDTDPIVRERAAAALSRRGEKAIRYFTEAMAPGHSKETRFLAVDRIGELAKGMQADPSKKQFDALMGIFDEPNPDPLLLSKASKVLDVLCNNVVDLSSKGSDVAEMRRSMAKGLADAIEKLRNLGSNYAEVAGALELRRKVVTPPEGNPETLWQALINLWDQAYKTSPAVASAVMLAAVLWATCAVVLLVLSIVRARSIVSFREWVLWGNRPKDPNKLLRSACDILLQPVSPMRWWDGNARVLGRWVEAWLPVFRKNLGIDEGVVRSEAEAVTLCSGEPCKPVEPKDLDTTIARAFTKSRSGILILGEDEGALEWITKYVARWAIGERRSDLPSDPGGDPAADYPPMLPVVINGSEIAGEGQTIPDKTVLRQQVRRAVGELIRQHHPPISRELHTDLVVNRRLLVIYKAEPESAFELTTLIRLIQENYKDWVVTTRELGAYNARVAARRVTMMKVRTQESEASKYGCLHQDHYWGAAIRGIFEPLVSGLDSVTSLPD